jgi:hypothetical protein
MKKVITVVFILLLIAACSKKEEGPNAKLAYAPSLSPDDGSSNVCVGANVRFWSTSIDHGNSITSWKWTFLNGTPSSYNGENPPRIYYYVEGKAGATLTTTNTIGTDVCTNSFDVVQCK